MQIGARKVVRYVRRFRKTVRKSQSEGFSMGMLKGVLKTGLALKAFEVVRREAAKPANQAKAKELMTKAVNAVNSRSGGTRRH